VRGEQLLAGHAAGVALHVVDGVVVDVQRRQARAGGAERDDEHQRRRRGVAGDPGADARPEPRLFPADRTGARNARPEGCPSGDEQRGQERGLREQRGHDADGTDWAETVQRGGVGGQQAEHGAGDRGGGGGERGQGGAQRGGHRGLGHGVAAQFLPVPVREQQGVVAGRAEDQDDEDVGRQRGHGEPGVGEAVRGRLRHHDRGDRAEQRKQPQEGGLVDEQQDDRHDDQRGEQQGGLLVASAAVRVDGRRPGHRADEPGWCLVCRVGDRGADGFDRVLVGAAGLAGLSGDVHGERRRLAVGRVLQRARRREAGHVPVKARDVGAGGCDRGLVGRCQGAVVAGEDDDGRVGRQLAPGAGVRCRLRSGFLEQHDLGGGSRGRQVGRRGVVCRVRQAAGQPVQQDDGEQPYDHGRPAQPPQPGREPVVRRPRCPPARAAGVGGGIEEVFMLVSVAFS
jgi:hypothetical protein